MRLLFIQMALGLFQADMAVKHEIETRPEFEERQEFLDGRIRVQRFHNHGMAGGKFAGHMSNIIRFSGLMTAGAMAAFGRLLWKPGRAIEKTGFAFLTGGALSNLYDRCRRGYVVDYVSFRTPWEKFNRLIFNISDFFIFIGMLLICTGQGDHSQR